MKQLNLAINGFGRIGRIVLRLIYQHGLQKNLKIAALNDLTDSRTLAHLLKHDSVHRKFDQEVSWDDNSLTVGPDKIKIMAVKNPAELPWKDMGVEVVLECTGLFTKREKAAQHLQAGARKVLISAPSPDADVTLAYGVNTAAYQSDKHDVLSCASCTTNCLAPVAAVIVDNFGVSRASMTTIHSYTNDQNVLDLPHKDLRRARAAGMSMIPTTTGAAKAIGLVIPKLAGKADGFAVRVPTPDVSLVDFVAEVERDTTVEEVNRALKTASQNSLKGILGFSEEPLVSSDFIGCEFSSVVDAASTMVIQKRLVKVVAWYDNEVGFSARMVDVCRLIGEKL
ncbi:MAG: type I glyceraldehyde-3-phosphate dehydrogenase [Proteobacteria bacterium]|nr:MAG: type I glyceraldehyde-3-phosphate dehydrogenase [Pseudomonadota bacterium]